MGRYQDQDQDQDHQTQDRLVDYADLNRIKAIMFKSESKQRKQQDGS